MNMNKKIDNMLGSAVYIAIIAGLFLLLYLILFAPV